MAKPSEVPIPRLHAIVRGRVQGVGFRFFVEREARALGLTGWARNLNDGSVEVVAEGAQESLEELEARLVQGPAFSAVEAVESTWSTAQERSEGFRIL